MVVFIIIIALAIGGGFFFVWYNSEEQVVKRRLRSLPRTQIRQISEGSIVKVVGRVNFCNQPLIAPFSGRPCTYYKVIVDEYVRDYDRDNENSGHWKTVIEEVQEQDFILKDETGQCVVRMVNAKCAVNKDANFQSGTFRDASPVLENFLASYNKSATSFFGLNKSMRYKEGIFEANEKVAVIGVAHYETDPTGYRWLMIYGHPDQALMVSDDKKLTAA
jgi:hypothetical protein